MTYVLGKGYLDVVVQQGVNRVVARPMRSGSPYIWISRADFSGEARGHSAAVNSTLHPVL